jgi:hypothetical protein
LLNYRVYYHTTKMQQRMPMIHSIYIVSDTTLSDAPITPGTLCREYLYGHPATHPSRTRVVLQSSDPTTSVPWILTLADLYPYPSVYSGLTASEQVQLGRAKQPEIALQMTTFDIPDVLSTAEMQTLLQTAQQAALQDGRTNLHPMQYGAAVAYGRRRRSCDKDMVDGNPQIHFLQACQRKALEYGSTQDAICSLLGMLLWEQQRSSDPSGVTSKPSLKVLALVMVDQFGIPHVPFAPARSMLVEHGFGRVPIVLTTTDPSNSGRWKVTSVLAQELCPFVPDFVTS